MRSSRKGFTLVELLVVIAIIAVLAAILFPLFSMARAAAQKTKCCSNIYQITQATQIWAQDHNNWYPAAASYWASISLDKQVFRCPASNAPYGYVFNSFMAGQSIASVREVDSSTLMLADGLHEPTPAASGMPATYQGIAYTSTDLAFRHAGYIDVSYADGHANSTKDTRDLPIEFRTASAAEFDGVDNATKGTWWTPTAKLRLLKLANGTYGSVNSQFLYGSQGYVLCNWDGSGNAVTNLTAPGSTSYVASVTPTGLTPIMWAATSSDPRALVNPQGGQAAACWSGNGTIAITLKSPTDTAIHTLHVYCVDWNHTKRSMQLGVLSCSATGSTAPNSAPVLKIPVSVTLFGEGTWVYIRFRGNIALNLQGGTQAVVSALMFD